MPYKELSERSDGLPATRHGLHGRILHQLFVNRRAYTLQSTRPHPDTGRHYYYRPKARDGEAPPALSLETLRQHLAGEITIAIYAINPKSSGRNGSRSTPTTKCPCRSAQAAIRARQDGVDPALEKSNRGGHLWIFFEQPALARDCRVYVYHTAMRLGLPIKGAGLPEGLKSSRGRTNWPKANSETLSAPRWASTVEPAKAGAAGSGFMAPITRSRTSSPTCASCKRCRPSSSPASSRAKPCPRNSSSTRNGRRSPNRYISAPASEFRILDYVEVRRQVGRNWIARCPSCAAANHDRSGDNLAISVEEPRKYICWAGCTKEMIRNAIGRPIPENRRYA